MHVKKNPRNVRFIPKVLAVLAIPIILTVAPVSAQNLITNGAFDTDVSGWTANIDRFDWISADGAPPSGNGCVEQADSFNNGGVGLSDWATQIPVTADTLYTLSASIKKPAGSLATSAWLSCLFLDTNGDYLGESISDAYQGDLSDNAWHGDFSIQITTTGLGYTVGALWVSVGVGTPSSGTGESVLRWDNVSLVQGTGTTAPIFSDDFESGGVTNWDETVPAP